jgi:predicted RND superfamily exporter protein
MRGEGLPDSRADASLVLEHLFVNGIPGVVPPRDVQAVLSRGDAQGTFDMAQITIEAWDVAGTKASEMLSEIREDSDPIEGVPWTEVHYAGYVFERHVLMDSMTEGMVVSTVVTSVICTLMVVLLFWSFRFGVTAALPVVLVTVWVLGAAFLLGFDLNPVTTSTTAMTVGIGIDYSITERYR